MTAKVESFKSEAQHFRAEPIGTKPIGTKKRRSWFERNFWYFVFLMLVLAVFSRFWDLGAKPFHHDESLHAYYSHIIATGGVREYDPLLHGPFLYYFVGFWQFVSNVLFGTGLSDVTARAPAAFFGVLVVMSPLLVRKLCGSIGTLVLMLFFLISPTTLYFGRFLREDVFTSIWVLGTLFGAALSRILPDNRNAELRFGRVLQIEFPFTPKTAAAIFASSMMAFHFTNKENSFLHAALWGVAIVAIVICERIFCSDRKSTSGNEVDYSTLEISIRGESVRGESVRGESVRRVILSTAIFVFIFVVFFSSFFRHSQGWYSGVLDGLYRKSLVYWWQQDQQRRIDGPFDYHLPIIANYEFLLLPFLGLAWFRVVVLSRRLSEHLLSRVRFVLTRGKLFYPTVIFVLALIIATMFLPRLALVSEGCSFSDIACASGHPLGCHGAQSSPFCFLHISHTRHLLQIVVYAVAGAIAFLSSMHVGRRIDAFLWFWLTGALGVYSYVGEKVPWLTLYIIFPILLIAGLETARILGPGTLPVDSMNLSKRRAALYAEKPQIVQKWKRKIAQALLPIALVWLAVAIPFTAFKAWHVAFLDAANPDERLVFTQTSPAVKAIRDRWELALRSAQRKQVERQPQATLQTLGNTLASTSTNTSINTSINVCMDGEATWPLAWYVLPFKNFNFVNTTTDLLPLVESHRKTPYTAIFTNERPMAEVARLFPDFDIYKIALRAWWVPKPNPSFSEIANYFGTRTLYPNRGNDADAIVGRGNTTVLYLEYVGKNSPFSKLPPFEQGELIARSSLQKM